MPGATAAGARPPRCSREERLELVQPQVLLVRLDRARQLRSLELQTEQHSNDRDRRENSLTQNSTTRHDDTAPSPLLNKSSRDTEEAHNSARTPLPFFPASSRKASALAPAAGALALSFTTARMRSSTLPFT